MRPIFLLRRVCMSSTRFFWLVPLALLWGSSVSLVEADNGNIKSLSVTAAPGPGPLDATFSINETSLTVTSTATPPGADTTFDGTIDFGDATGTATGEPPPPMTVQSQTVEKKFTPPGSDTQFGFAIAQKGEVSHTYPAPGTYNATFNHCCLSKFKVAYQSLYVTTDIPPGGTTSDVNVAVSVTVGGSSSSCKEETQFKQLGCQIDKLNTAVDDAGITRTGVVNTLKNQLGDTKTKVDETAAQCTAGDDGNAKKAMSSGFVKIKAFISTVDKNPNIDDGAESTLTSQATPIRDSINDLILNGVCHGNECLPDPPLGALHCEVGRLLDDVAADVTDTKLATFFVGKLDAINGARDAVIAACDAGKPKKTVSKLNSMLGALKAIAAKLKVVEKKGTLPADVIATLRQGAGRVQAIVDGLLLNGACS
jgi:hypothetical protein